MKSKTGAEAGICLFLTVFLMVLLSANTAYPQDADEIRKMIEFFKADERGPFDGIRWFCKDGTILPARQPCGGEDEGIQHGIHRAWVKKLAKEKGIYLGQVLAGTEFAAFWDSRNQNSRVQQFIIEKFLQSADDGWIFRKARYYRGAIQMEDEEEWGQKFLEWMLADIKRVESQFFLLREAVKEIPHGASENLWESIRADSRTVAESYRAFEALRVKLHGRPEASDMESVRNFHAEHRGKMSSYAEQKIRKLIQDLEKAFAPPDLRSLGFSAKKFSPESPVRIQLEEFIAVYGRAPEKISPADIKDQCRRISRMLVEIRIRMLLRQSGRGRLSYTDLSLDLEKILFRHMNAWQPVTARDLLEKSYILAEAAVGCGLLELWEWEKVRPMLALPENTDRLRLGDLTEKAAYSRRVTEWGTGMIRSVYEPGVKIFSAFEPLTAGFMDDRIRSTVLLSLGDTAAQLSALTKEMNGTANSVMGKSFPGMRGLNPGFAKGELDVAGENTDAVSFSGEKIYVLPRIPSDIRPVAGIASVSEGNLVSHVQLLARNLGIPNAILSPDEAKALLPYSGKTVFYAVSPAGTVIMKSESDMTGEERNLTDKGTRKEERILVPTDRIDLGIKDMPGLRQVRAPDSGKICGPKAANLGELKHLFPDNVVEGLVIPFGVFRLHMDQSMPGTVGTFWDFLGQVFDRAEAERQSGRAEKDIENAVLKDLEKFRASLRGLTFLPDFRQHLTVAFEKEFGLKMGNIPVFIRSDTNMEDLKEFTGAGLNLTVFNVRDAESVWQGIRDVWASPFTERGYLWRQKYMRNPENVYPSILIMPTVTVEKSGVMITTDVSGSDSQGITLAFSAGPGGAVEGQAAETWLLKSDRSDQFLSPSRESKYYVLPEKGGSYKGYRHFHMPLLSPEERMQLRDFAGQVKTVMAAIPGMEGPWDVELGLKQGKIWLFQIRPFVENRHARASAYLRNIDPDTDAGREIRID